MGGRGLQLSGLGDGKIIDCLNHSSGIYFFMKCGEFFAYLRNCQLPKMDSAPCSKFCVWRVNCICVP